MSHRILEVKQFWASQTYVFLRTRPSLTCISSHISHICIPDQSLIFHSHVSYSHSVPKYSCGLVASPIYLSVSLVCPHLSSIHLYHYTLIPRQTNRLNTHSPTLTGPFFQYSIVLTFLSSLSYNQISSLSSHSSVCHSQLLPH